MPKRIFVVAALTLGALVVMWTNAPIHSSAKNVSSIYAAVAKPDAGPCAGAGLSLAQIDKGVEMGGIGWLDYEFKNNGSSACTLNGFPRVQLLNARGQVVHAKLVHNEEETPAAVTIAPNQPARFRVRYKFDGPHHKGAPCPASVKRLQLQAPGTTRWFDRKDEVPLCDQVMISAIYLPPAQ